MFFESVLANLKKQINYFSQINELCEREKQFIIENNIDGISDIVEQLRVLHSKTTKEEKARVELIKIYNSKELSGKEDITLDDIIEICTDEKVKEEMIKAKDELVCVLKQQKELDETINQMLKINLNYCEYMLTAFSQEISPNNLYSRDGSEVGNDRSAVRILDSEV